MVAKAALGAAIVLFMLAGCSGSGPNPGPSGQSAGSSAAGGHVPAVTFEVDESNDRLLVGLGTDGDASWDRLAARLDSAGLGGGNALRMGSNAPGGYQNELATNSGAELVEGRVVKIGNGADRLTDSKGEYVDFCTYNGQNSEVRIVIVDQPSGQDLGSFHFVNVDTC